MPKRHDATRNTTQIYIPAGMVNPDEDVVVEVPLEYSKHGLLVAQKSTISEEFDSKFPSANYSNFETSLRQRHTQRGADISSPLAQAENLEKSVVLSQLEEYQQSRRKMLMQSEQMSHLDQSVPLPSVVSFPPPPPPVWSTPYISKQAIGSHSSIIQDDTRGTTKREQFFPQSCSTLHPKSCEAATSPALGFTLSVPPLPNTPFSGNRFDSSRYNQNYNFNQSSSVQVNTNTEACGSRDSCNHPQPEISYEHRKISCPICESICGVKNYDSFDRECRLTDKDIEEIRKEVEKAKKKLKNVIDSASENGPYLSDRLEKPSTRCLIRTENGRTETALCLKKPDSECLKDRRKILPEEQIRNINHKIRDSQQIFHRRAAELKATLESVLNNKYLESSTFEPPCTSSRRNTEAVNPVSCQTEPVSSTCSKKSILKQNDLICPQCKKSFTETRFSRHNCTNPLLAVPETEKAVTVSAMVTVLNDPEITFYNESFPVQSGSEGSMLSNVLNLPENDSSSSLGCNIHRKRNVPSKHKAITCEDEICSNSFSSNTPKISTKNAETFCHLQVSPAVKTSNPKLTSVEVGTDSQHNASAWACNQQCENGLTISESELKKRVTSRLQPASNCTNSACPKKLPKDFSCQSNLTSSSRSVEPIRTAVTLSGKSKDSACQFTSTRSTRSAEPICNSSVNKKKLNESPCQFNQPSTSRSAKLVSYNLTTPNKEKISSSQFNPTSTPTSANAACDIPACPAKLKDSSFRFETSPVIKSSGSFCTSPTCPEKFKDTSSLPTGSFCVNEACPEKYKDVSNQFNRASGKSSKPFLDRSAPCKTGSNSKSFEVLCGTPASSVKLQVTGNIHVENDLDGSSQAISPSTGTNDELLCVNSSCPYRASGEKFCNPRLCDPEYAAKKKAKSYSAILILKRRREKNN